LDISNLCKCIVPITQFNKGKASQNFSRATNGESLLVIKNNAPVAVVLSLAEYSLLRSFSKICKKHADTGSAINKEELKSLLEKLEALDKGDE
jgi:hypothetical protein